MLYHKKILLLMVWIWGLNGIPASGGSLSLLDETARDLSRLEARLIEGPGEGFLLNRGSRDQVQKGDLWTIYSPGESVVDPVSGADLGTYSSPLAVARVTRAAEKFAELAVRCLKKECDLQAGLEAVRFQDIQALYLDEKASTFSQYKKMRKKLDHLDWQGYMRKGERLPEQLSSPFKVVLAAAGNSLTLWSGGELLSIYPRSVKKPVRQSAGERGQPSSSSPATSSVPESAGLDQTGFATETAVKEAGGTISLDQPVYSIGITTFPGKRSYLLYLGDRTVQARALQGKKKHQYTYEGFGSVVNMSVAHDGLLALNIYVPDKGMRSKILRLTDAGFQAIIENIDYVLSFGRDPADGGKARLLGQPLDHDDLLRSVAYRLEIRKDRVVRVETLDPPPGYSLFGAFQTDLNGNGVDEIGYFNPGGRLVLYESGRKIWESSSGPAGALRTLLIGDPDYDDAAPSELEVWSQPEVFRHGDRTYVAFALNQQDSWMGLVGGGPREGTVGFLYYGENSYRLHLPVHRFPGPVQDLHIHNDELLVAVGGEKTYSGKGTAQVLTLSLGSLLSKD